MIKFENIQKANETIKTTDIPNVDLLQLGGRYKIYSINTFKKTKEPDINHIQTEKNKLE